MLLATSLAPRLDGTVIAHGASGQTYTFQHSDEHGCLVADVTDERDVAHMLRHDWFSPALEADMDAAEAILTTGVAGGAATADTDPDSPADLDGEGDDDDDDGLEGDGQPVEANTAPKAVAAAAASARGRARKAKAAGAAE